MAMDDEPKSAIKNTGSFVKIWKLAKSLVLPTPATESRSKVELKGVQDPVLIIPIDAKFSNVIKKSNIAQCAMISPQMVHVEKPKAENLQACSVAFLPVASMFSKEATGHPNVVPSTSLLSCQAFECFDVLTTLMQASGYQVAHQSNVLHKNDSPVPINLHKSKSNTKEAVPQCAKYKSTSSHAKIEGGKPKRRKRKATTQKVEGLNLCKRESTSTKPIVSSTIANSIAEIKVPTVVSSAKKSKQETVKAGFNAANSNQTSVISKTPDFNSGVSVIVKSPPSLPQSSPHPCDDGHSEPICLVKGSDESGIKDQNLDFIENNEDSSASSNLEAFIIESCAKEILDYIKQKIEDTVMKSKLTGQLPTFLDETFKIASNSSIGMPPVMSSMTDGNNEKCLNESFGIVETNKSIKTKKSSLTFNEKQTSKDISEKISSMEDSQLSESLESEQNHFTEIINDILNNAESCDKRQKENAAEVFVPEIEEKLKTDEERTSTVIINTIGSKSLSANECINLVQNDEIENSETETKPISCKERTLTCFVADEDDEKTLENEDNSRTIENADNFGDSELLKLSFETENMSEITPSKKENICSLENEENSDTMDADLKEDPKLSVDFNGSQNETNSEVKCEVSDELSKDSSTQFVTCSSEFEEDPDDTPKE
ncbi:uncharacterized protein [Parasteatoda tepidariorum]|uniref:uncharacterized protein n=1 Tax=Parasteatoda tepidariorum TaxID=114398 RepID=UPI0039BD1A4D